MLEESFSHVMAPTQFIEGGGTRFAYRYFGKSTGTPIVCMPHFRAGMDHWDPAVTDGLARTRKVILFDNAGVSDSGGITPNSIEEMADDAASFLTALRCTKVDLLGFSIGGHIAQAFAIRHPDLLRRLILTDTGPRGGEVSKDPKFLEYGASTDPTTGEGGLEAFLYLFFTPSAKSQAAGRAFWERRHLRKTGNDRPSTPQTMAAQRAAITAWNQTNPGDFSELREIKHPTLIANGSHDIMIPTINAYNLSQNIPDAQLIIYPDSGHAAIFQYPELFLKHAELFLDGLH
jgi:pimeloyl-ACP methyl ester carboxylesterase